MRIRGVIAVAGLLLAMAAVIGRARADRSVKDGAEASELAGAPNLGAILREDCKI